MNEMIFTITIITCAYVFISSFFRYDELLQFPFLITCDLLIFMGPQLYYLLQNKSLYENYGNSSFFTFVSVCLLFYVCALYGYSAETTMRKIPSWQFNSNILILGLFVLSAVSVYGRSQLAALPEELKSGGQWTGLPVRYLFFGSVGTLCIPLGIVLFFKYKNKLILIPLMVEVVNTLLRVVLHGRRSPAVFTGIMVLTGLWFGKRLKVPTGAIISVGLVFVLFVANVGIYRDIVLQEDVDWNKAVSEVFNVKKTISRFSGDTSTHSGDLSDLGNYVDALNGLVRTQAALTSFRYDYGSALWNDLVHSWVPGQLVGHKLKKALKFKIADRDTVPYDLYKYKFPIGSCTPGYAELFVSLGVFGAIFMYYMGKMARMIWEEALAGNLIAQTAHFALAPVYIRFGGGGLWTLLSGLFFWVIFLWPIYVLAKKNISYSEMLESDV